MGLTIVTYLNLTNAKVKVVLLSVALILDLKILERELEHLGFEGVMLKYKRQKRYLHFK